MVKSAAPIAYQLRVVLRGISPLIWHRLLVRGNSTIADLHHALQSAFGWTDTHLHRFVIHGKDYGIARLGGRSFADNPARVPLADLRLRLRERLLYQYDFGADWPHDLRVEHIVRLDPRRAYPVCIGGARTAPPEDCGGPWAVLDLRQHHHPAAIAGRLTAIVGAMQGAADPDAVVDDRREELAELVRWATIERFDRRHGNRRLAWYTAGDDRWWSEPGAPVGRSPRWECAFRSSSTPTSTPPGSSRGWPSSNGGRSRRTRWG